MVKLVGFDLPAALFIFVGFCCEGLLAFSISCLVAAVVHCPLQ